MIIITGGVTARADSFDALRRESLDHVARSRLEPGRLLHSVHVDCENPLRLVFVEHWSDKAALDVHFKQPGSAKLMRAVATLASENTGIAMFDATPVT